MQQLDTDGDGLLSPQEFSQRPVVPGADADALSRAFARADSDADGALSKSEVFAMLDPTSETWCRLHAGRLVRHCDADDDGVLDGGEFSACPVHDGRPGEDLRTNAEPHVWPLFPKQFFHGFWW